LADAADEVVRLREADVDRVFRLIDFRLIDFLRLLDRQIRSQPFGFAFDSLAGGDLWPI
jgi:hypothetical protein